MPDRRLQARALKLAVAVWLLLISAVAIVNGVGLSRLAAQLQASARDTPLQALTTHVAELGQQIDAQQRQPTPISQADFATAQQALDARLARIEQAQEESGVQTDDLQSVQARVSALETHLQHARQTKAPSSTTRRRTPVAAAPAPRPTPPFDVLGVELRGGERFLAIAAPGARSLADLRLLRVGEADGAWQLQAIEAQAAVFRVHGRTQRVAVP